MLKIMFYIVAFVVFFILSGCSSPYEEEYRELEHELLVRRHAGNQAPLETEKIVD